MIKLQKSSLILILIVVVLTAGCVSIYTLGYTPGSAWHRAEDVKSGTFGQNVGNGNYNFPGNVGIKKTNPSSELDVTGNIYTTGQITAGTKIKVGASEITSGKVTGLDAPTNSSDAANKAYVDNHTNTACKLVGNNIICSGIPDNTAGTLSITKNGITCPIWKDCDGDGYTYGNKDCDESCSICYVGSSYYTDSPDGKDKDCNGVVDEHLSPATLGCYVGTTPFPYLEVAGEHCNQANDDAYCTSVCERNGWGRGTTTCFREWGCFGDECAVCYGANFVMGTVATNNGNHRVTCSCASGYR